MQQCRVRTSSARNGDTKPPWRLSAASSRSVYSPRQAHGQIDHVPGPQVARVPKEEGPQLLRVLQPFTRDLEQRGIPALDGARHGNTEAERQRQEEGRRTHGGMPGRESNACGGIGNAAAHCARTPLMITQTERSDFACDREVVPGSLGATPLSLFSLLPWWPPPQAQPYFWLRPPLL